MDWLGAAFITCGLVLLTFSLGDGETAAPSQWKSAYIIALLVVSVLLIVAFVAWEYYLGGWSDDDADNSIDIDAGEKTDFEHEKVARPRSRWSLPRIEPGQGPDPLLHLAIFRRAHGKLAVMVSIAFFVWAGFSGWNFYAVVRRPFFSLLHFVHCRHQIEP